LLYKPAANLSINSFSDAESLIGLEVALIDGPLLATVPLLVLILSPGKKQNVVARSSAEAAEYRAMAPTTSEMLWVCRFALSFVT
jgi:hypothetical protein